MSAVEARLAAVEARLAEIEKRLSAVPSTSSSSNGNVGNGATPTDVFADEKLEADWANKTVSKDPPRWHGESMVGRLFSDCPAEWHDNASGFYEYKARKGREENPPRLKNNGKPWHESDTFTAKLHRTWARRIRQQAASAPVNTAEQTSLPNDDDIPF